MGLFSNKEEEVRRKRNLKELEDKRVRFAERLAAEARHPFYRAAAAYLGALLADWPSEA